MNIQAIATKSKKVPFSVAATHQRALALVGPMLARAGVEMDDSTGKVSALEVTEKLRAHGVPAERRLEAKIALERAGLLSE